MDLYKENVLQIEDELDKFCDLLQGQQVKSYLEIGSKFGGSLWRVANALPVGSKIVSVDLPLGTKVWKHSERALKACVLALNDKGYDAKIIWGDSTAGKIIDLVRESAPFDCVFIDANHTTPYLRKDWDNYGAMARIVAFHDISWERPDNWEGVRIDVKPFWEDLKNFYRHIEFKLDPKGKDNGIGVLWRY